MARKPKSFRLDEKKKVIVLYTNIRIEAENDLINFYLDRGYTPMYEEKKDSIKIDDMRKDLEADNDALKAFENAYKEKDGFFKACKIYSDWKKNKINDMRKDLEADNDALKAFEKAYKEKNGFSKACKIYSDWKKNNK